MSRIYIDVREKFEFAMGRVKGAINIPLEKVMGEGVSRDISKETNIVVYCRTGSRSGVAKQILNQQGYRHVVNGVNRAYIEANL